MTLYYCPKTDRYYARPKTITQWFYVLCIQRTGLYISLIIAAAFIEATGASAPFSELPNYLFDPNIWMATSILWFGIRWLWLASVFLFPDEIE